MKSVIFFRFSGFIKSVFFLLLCLQTLDICAQGPGPADIGSSSSNAFWLRNEIQGVTGSTSVPFILDRSGKDNNAYNSANAVKFTSPAWISGVKHDINFTDNFTVEAWVKPESVIPFNMLGNVEGQRFVFYPTDPNTAGWGSSGATMGISVGTNGIIVYEKSAAAFNPVIQYPASLNGWVHIAVVYTNKTASLYVNYTAGGSSASPSSFIVHPPFDMGTTISTQCFTGSIDEVRIWNNSQTQTEVNNFIFQQFGELNKLVRSWTFDEIIANTVKDASGKSSTGTLNGGVSSINNNQAQSGSWLYFNDPTDVVNMPKPDISVINNFTVEAWVFPDRSLVNGQNFLFAAENAGKAAVWGNPDHAGMGISVCTDGIKVYENSNGSLLQTLNWVGAIGFQWSHIAVVYLDRTPNLYVNGILVSTGTKSGKATVHPPFSMGSLEGGNNYFGHADEVRIWNKALTISEITANKSKHLTLATGLLYNYYLDENSSSQIFDYSGNNNTATFSSTTVRATDLSPITSAPTLGAYGKLYFNQFSSRLYLPSKPEINAAATTTGKTFITAFEITSDATARQVIYKQGGTSAGITIYIFKGRVYAGMHNSSGFKSVSAPIALQSKYVLTFTYDAVAGTVSGFLNGNTMGTVTGTGALPAHEQGVIGAGTGITKYHDGPAGLADGSINSVYLGYIYDLLLYNTVINTAQRKILENFYSSTYSIPLATTADLFTFESAGYNLDYRGIGSDDATNQHLSATSDILTFSGTNPASGFFALIAHNSNSNSTIIAGYNGLPYNTPKNVNRIDRSWRLDLTGQGNLNFQIPQSVITSMPIPVSFDNKYQKAVLILDSDGDFKTGSRIIALNSIGTNYTIDNVKVLDGDYVSFGRLNMYYGLLESYTSGIDALGKADLNYEVNTLVSDGLSIKYPSALEPGDYLLAGNNSGTTSITLNGNPSTSIVRAARTWRINEYNDPGKVIISFTPSSTFFKLPDLKDTYVILLDRDGNNDWTNAEIYACVKEGSDYRANFIDLSEGANLAIGAVNSSSRILKEKLLEQTFAESVLELSQNKNKALVVKANELYPIATSCTQNTNKTKLNLLFNTGELHKYGDTPFNASADVVITGYDTYTSTTLSKGTYYASLKLNADEPEMLWYTDITDDIKLKGIKVYDVKVSIYNKAADAAINNDIQLKAYIEEEGNTFVTQTDASVITALSYTNTQKVYTFNWQTDNCGAPLYQFQLMKLYNIQTPANANEYVIQASPDWSQALTLETTRPSISLTMAEGTGYYAWRVRPVGTYYDGREADSRNWGTWSSVNWPITTTLTPPLSLNCTEATLSTCLATYGNSIFYFKQFDQDKNFIYNRVFTEDNKIHEGITYANGLSMVKQTQVKVPSNNDNIAGTTDGEVIASQTVYDYSGRPALSTMAAPILDADSELGYRSGLVKSATGLYGPQNFDKHTETDSKIQAPDPVDPATGGWINFYYSDKNTDATIPGAENFPFSRTLYTNDGRGKVLEQSGPGKEHKMGSGHTIQITDGSVTEDELLAIFGDEAPAAANVYKSVTTDQNGVQSIAYISSEGKTIATCLAGSSLATSLTALDDSPGTGVILVKDELNNNIPSGENGISASRNYTFTETTDVKLNFEITPAFTKSQCGAYCATCGYLLRIKILDLQDNKKNKVIEKVILPGDVKDPGTCSTAVNTIDLDPATAGNELKITLQPGKYTIEKTVELYQGAAKTYATNLLTKSEEDIKPTIDKVKDYLTKADINGLNTYLETLQEAITGPKIEIYSEAGALLFSNYDNITTNNTAIKPIVDGSKVKIITNCCSVEIPIIFPDYNPCKDTKITSTTLGTKFAEIITSKTGLSMTQASTSNGVTRYTLPAEFNALISNMRGDNYTCEALYNCIESTIKSYQSSKSTRPSGSPAINTADESKKQENMEDWMKTESDNIDNKSKSSFVDQFLDCAGYTYAGFIMDKSITANADLLKFKPYKFFYYNRTGQTDPKKNDAQKLCEDAFCNFNGVYISGTIPTSLTYSPCGKAPGALCNKTTSTLPETYITSAATGSANYTKLIVEGRNLAKYDYINLKSCVQNEVSSTYAMGTTPLINSVTLKATAEKQRDKLLKDCDGACDRKYQFFYDKLTTMNNAPFWGTNLLTNSEMTFNGGGWLTSASAAVTFTADNTLKLSSQPSGQASSTYSLTTGKKYYLRFALALPVNSTLKVYNGSVTSTNPIFTTTIAKASEIYEVEFTANASNLIFVGNTTSGKDIVLDNVYLKQEMPALGYNSEDICCTARQLVDYCKQSCSITLVTQDCAPTGPGSEDILVSVGTSDEIKTLNAILYGTFEILPTQASPVCPAGFSESKLNLVSHYAFSTETNSTILDGSGYGFDGTGYFLTQTEDKAGKAKSAFLFNGSSSNITVGKGNRDISKSVTLSAWIKTTSTTDMWVAGKYNSTGNGFYLSINGGYASFNGRDGSSYDRSSGNSTKKVNDGIWHFITGVCDNGIWLIYIDGVLEKSFQTSYLNTNLSNSGDYFTIGKNPQSLNMYFSGTMDEIMLYNSALTARSVLNLFNNGNLDPYNKTKGACLNSRVLPYLQNNNKVSNSLPDFGNLMIQGHDGNFIGVGVTNTKDILLYKVNKDGQIFSQKVITGNQDDEISKIIKSKDGGYLLAGSTKSTNFQATTGAIPNGAIKGLIVKLDADLNPVWNKIYGGSNMDNLSDIIETNSGEIYAVGKVRSKAVPGDVTENCNAADLCKEGGWILKVDQLGNMLSQRRFTNSIANGYNFYSFNIIKETKAGNLFVVASSKYHNGDFTLLKINKTDLSFSQSYNSSNLNNETVSDFRELSNGELLLLGKVTSSNLAGAPVVLGGSDVFVLKLTQDLNYRWNKIIEGNGLDEISTNAFETNGIYVFGFNSNSTNLTKAPLGSMDIYIIGLDLAGDVKWENRLGGNGYTFGNSLVESEDGGIYVLGKSESLNIFNNETNNFNVNNGEYDIYLSKIRKSETDWERLYGGNHGESPFTNSLSDINSPLDIEKQTRIFLTSDGGLLLHTHSNSDISGNMTSTSGNTDGDNIWMVKLSFGSNTTCTPRRMCVKWVHPQEIVPAKPQVQPPVIVDNNDQTIQQITESIKNQETKCKANSEQMLLDEYKQYCSNTSLLKEKFTTEYTIKYQQYTLYYYDRAGNLVRTVPPAGVKILSPSTTGVRERKVNPGHEMVTTYKYNSIGQLIEQTTPDGGTTKFIYNKSGMLRFSQNAEQASTTVQKYSYTRYDSLGRAMEVGQANVSGGNLTAFDKLKDAEFLDNNPLGNVSYPTTGAYEQTYTVYGKQAANVGYMGIGQRYLRNRISYVYSNSLYGEKAVTYYSYDPHGNVDWLVQEVPGLGKNYIGYEYDLISNKVLKVKYNEQLKDQFYHRYTYDADNRITGVSTSRNGKIWDKDANYIYYKHGPLKRMEVGEDKIQGVDYTYTLHGWLKGINTPVQNTILDPGKDGSTNNLFARDEFGMMLGYYKGDFVRKNSPFSDSYATNPLLLTSDKPLYNGNITSWTSRIRQQYRDAFATNSTIPEESFTTGNLYRYDLLNRIKESNFSTYGGNQVKGAYTATNDYKTSYTYDGNGNIKKLNRNGFGASLPMDKLTYVYEAGKNRLLQVKDSILTDAYSEDVTNQTATNYGYDNIGNLIKDIAEKTDITWTVSGKISRILPQPGTTKPEIRYTYDASGNRIKKELNIAPYTAANVYQRLPDKVEATYYVRDASGNVMAIYKRKNTAVAGTPDYYTATFTTEERPVYGSSRLGYSTHTESFTKTFYKDDLDNLKLDQDVFARVTDGKNLETATEESLSINDKNSTAQAIRVSRLLTVTTSGTEPYTYTVNIQNSFAGQVKENIAIAEDKDKNLQFYASNAANYWGKTNVTLVYDKDNKLMPGCAGILADAKAQSAIVKRPGSASEFYMVTVTSDGRLRYHVVDLSMPGNGTAVAPKGAVKSTNQLLDADDNTTYGNAVIALENYASGKAMIYATRHVAGKMEVVVFDISDKTTIAQTPVVMTSLSENQNLTGQSELQISPDGKKLLVVNHKKRTGWFNYQNTDMIIFNLGYDYRIVSNEFVQPETVNQNATLAGISADFSSDSRYLFYSRNLLVKTTTASGSERVLRRYDLRNKLETTVSTSVSGDIRRSGTDLLEGSSLNTKLASFATNAYNVTSNRSLTELSNMLSGGISPQNHKIWFDQPLAATLTRVTNKKYYELSDHLGNVRVVLTDRKNQVTEKVTNDYYQDFEGTVLSDAPWTGWSKTQEEVYSGSSAVKVSSANYSGFGVCKMFDVKPGDKISSSVYMKFNSGTKGGIIVFAYINAAGNAYYQNVSTEFTESVHTKKGEWVKIIIPELTIYQDAVKVSAYLRVNSDEGQSDSYFDDWEINHKSVNSSQNYVASVSSYSDFYPFGLTMPGRSLIGTYRYGFNGKELDKGLEGMGGGGSTYDYGFRIYNPAIAKFLSVDPLTKDYPHFTPYQYAGNTPISAIDIDGLEPDKDFNANETKPDNSEGGGVKDLVVGYGKAIWQNAENRIDRIQSLKTEEGRSASLQGIKQTFIDLVNNPIPNPLGVAFLNFANELPNKSTGEIGEMLGAMTYNGINAYSDGVVVGGAISTTLRLGISPINKAIAFSKSKGWMGSTTILGDDAATALNASRMVPEPGIHQVLLHGTPDGFIVNGGFVTPKSLARTLLESGYQRGTTIRLISCHTGVAGDGAAYQLSRYLKTPVMAPTNMIRTLPGGQYEIFGGGRFRTFFNTTLW